MSESIRTLSVNYMAAKAGLRAKLPGVSDDALEEIARALAAEEAGSDQRVGNSYTEDDRQSLLLEIGAIVGQTPMTAFEIHEKLKAKGKDVYAPYIGRMLTAAHGLFERTLVGQRSLYRQRAVSGRNGQRRP